MNELVNEKLDELFESLNDCQEIKELKELKSQIYQSEKLKVLLEEYRNSSNQYDAKVIDMKRKIIEDPMILRYHSLENELYYSILEVNQKLEKLFNKKRCRDANN